MTPPADEGKAPGGRPRQFRLRSLMMAVAVLAVVFAALRIPVVRHIVLLYVMALVVFCAAVALGWLGISLFDGLVSWARGPGADPLPDDEPD